MTSPAFVKNSQGASLLALSLTATKFNRRPSELLGILDEVIALDFDNAGAMKLQEWEDARALNLARVSNPWIEPPESDVRFESLSN